MRLQRRSALLDISSFIKLLSFLFCFNSDQIGRLDLGLVWTDFDSFADLNNMITDCIAGKR